MKILDNVNKFLNIIYMSGYYYDLPKVGRADFSRKYYDQDTRPNLDSTGFQCIPMNIYSQTQKGGAMVGTCLQGLMKYLAPLDVNSLMAVIILIAMQQYGKKMQGGSYVMQAEKVLMPMDKTALITIAGLLLLHYLTNKKKMKGGDMFQKKLIKLLKKTHNEKMKGGIVLDNVYKIIAPMGTNTFLATSLLIILNRLFTKKMKGGDDCGDSCQSGGKKDCNCGKAKGGRIEVVGDKALNYSPNLQQFGCKVPSWGYNIKVNGDKYCI